MIVNFVCSGNSFRSRLAEAYMKSLKVPGVGVISSGVHANEDKFAHITPYAALILKNEKLSHWASPDKTQLTQELLDDSDIVIAMNRSVYSECSKQGFRMPQRTYIWDINDIHFAYAQLEKIKAGNKAPEVTQTIYKKIRFHVDGLVAFLKRPCPTELIDVLDEHGKPTGKTSNIAKIHENGWWHIGMHAGLYTKSGKVLLERRSNSIVIWPGVWDITMGGLVVAGETPDKALLREANEELGIQLLPENIDKIFVWRYDHYLPHYGYHNRNFTHTYIARIPDDVQLKLQPEEVAEAKLVNIAEVHKMNDAVSQRQNSMIPTHAYNRKILDAIASKL